MAGLYMYLWFANSWVDRNVSGGECKVSKAVASEKIKVGKDSTL